VFGVYDLASRRVGVPHRSTRGVGLARPPRGEAEFRRLAEDVARSAPIRALLEG
jgi:hypothetical protein